MIERTGDLFSMWGQDNQVCIATVNTTPCSYGIVMGAGAAKQLRALMPDAPMILLGVVSYNDPDDFLFYNSPYFTSRPMWAVLQTKRSFRDPSPDMLVESAIGQLFRHATANPELTFHVPRPGCGYGGLRWATQVKPLFEHAPDNVVVWSRSRSAMTTGD